VNTPSTLGGIGATTNLFPALTLGCGAAAGGFTSDNVSPLNLINIRKVGYGVRHLEDITNCGQAGENVGMSEIGCSANQHSFESTDDLKMLLEKLIEQLK
jgi:hypothetical protein